MLLHRIAAVFSTIIVHGYHACHEVRLLQELGTVKWLLFPICRHSYALFGKESGRVSSISKEEEDLEIAGLVIDVLRQLNKQFLTGSDRIKPFETCVFHMETKCVFHFAKGLRCSADCVWLC